MSPWRGTGRMDRQTAFRFYRDFTSALGTTWLLVVLAAIVTQGRIGRYGALILPAQLFMGCSFGLYKARVRRRRRVLREASQAKTGDRFIPV